jgi:repressor LexA
MGRCKTLTRTKHSVETSTMPNWFYAWMDHRRGGLTDYAIAKAAGIAPASISNVKNGRSEPRRETMLQIARALGVKDSDFLRDFDAMQDAEIEEYRKRRADLSGAHGSPRAGHENPAATQPLHTETVPIRTLVGGDNPSETLEETDETFELLRHLAGPGKEVIRIEGNSMFPLLRNGYLVLVDRQARTKNGDVILARLNGASTISRYDKEGKRVTLRAENPEILPKVVEDGDKFEIVGKVTKIVGGDIE